MDKDKEYYYEYDDMTNRELWSAVITFMIGLIVLSVIVAFAFGTFFLVIFYGIFMGLVTIAMTICMIYKCVDWIVGKFVNE